MDDRGLEVETESTLIRRILAGDDQAFYKLVQPCQRNVYFAALSILSNEADAEEAAQEAMLKPESFTKLLTRKASSWYKAVIEADLNQARRLSLVRR